MNTQQYPMNNVKPKDIPEAFRLAQYYSNKKDPHRLGRRVSNKRLDPMLKPKNKEDMEKSAEMSAKQKKALIYGLLGAGGGYALGSLYNMGSDKKETSLPLLTALMGAGGTVYAQNKGYLKGLIKMLDPDAPIPNSKEPRGGAGGGGSRTEQEEQADKAEIEGSGQTSLRLTEEEAELANDVSAAFLQGDEKGFKEVLGAIDKAGGLPEKVRDAVTRMTYGYMTGSPQQLLEIMGQTAPEGSDLAKAYEDKKLWGKTTNKVLSGLFLVDDAIDGSKVAPYILTGPKYGRKITRAAKHKMLKFLRNVSNKSPAKGKMLRWLTGKGVNRLQEGMMGFMLGNEALGAYGELGDLDTQYKLFSNRLNKLKDLGVSEDRINALMHGLHRKIYNQKPSFGADGSFDRNEWKLYNDRAMQQMAKQKLDKLLWKSRRWQISPAFRKNNPDFKPITKAEYDLHNEFIDVYARNAQKNVLAKKHWASAGDKYGKPLQYLGNVAGVGAKTALDVLMSPLSLGSDAITAFKDFGRHYRKHKTNPRGNFNWSDVFRDFNKDTQQRVNVMRKQYGKASDDIAFGAASDSFWAHPFYTATGIAQDAYNYTTGNDLKY